jgi:hypothetical protein
MKYKPMTQVQQEALATKFGELCAVRGFDEVTVANFLKHTDMPRHMNWCVDTLVENMELPGQIVRRQTTISPAEARQPFSTLRALIRYCNSCGHRMPRPSPGPVSVVFFKNTNRIWGHDALKREFDSRGLLPAHPLAFGKVCEPEMKLWFSRPVTFWDEGNNSFLFKFGSFQHYVDILMPEFSIEKFRLSWWPKGTTFAGTPKAV